MGELDGKRFLICHSIVHDLIGSTIVTLDLATFLRDSGADVVVYAAFRGQPAMALFDERGIEVVDDATLAPRTLADFDYVWVHSQVLPVSLVDELADPTLEQTPTFVFLHMSAIDYAPDEHPYIHQLEERLSSLSLFVSEESREALWGYFDHPPPSAIYPNPTPAEYSAEAYQPRDAPESVLIISNHVPKEVHEAKELLRESGLRVVHVGRGGESEALVTADLLADHDVVITIGKTVQYCLVAGRPVYVYDHFGGFGYLDGHTLAPAALRNYSGRGGTERAADVIAREIVEGYAQAVRFHAARREEFIEQYSLESMVPRLLGTVQARDVVPFEPSFHRTVRAAQLFGARFYRFWGRNAQDVRDRAAMDDELRRAHEQTSQVRAELAHTHEEVSGLHSEIEQLHGTWTFRVGRWIVGPASAVVRGLKRLLGR